MPSPPGSSRANTQLYSPNRPKQGDSHNLKQALLKQCLRDRLYGFLNPPTRTNAYIVKSFSPANILSNMRMVFSTGECMMSDVLNVLLM